MTEGTQWPRHGGWLLTALLGGMFLGNVDIAIVNVATPSIQQHLHASGAELELIVSGYTLTYAVLLITSARLGGMRGYRRMFLIGLTVFTLASLACGLAPTPVLLVAARVVQGAGAALLTSQVLTSIQLTFQGGARSRALGLYTAVLSGSAVFGQVVGGVLVSADVFGTAWRPIFLINVPIGLGLILMGRHFLPTDGRPSTQRLDLAGVGVLSTALLLLVLPMVLGQDAGWPLWTWLSFAASLAAFVWFAGVERRVGRRGGQPLITLALLRRPPVVHALVSQAATRATYFALLFVLAQYLQQGLHKSATYSGLVLVSWVAAFGVSGPLLAHAPAAVNRWVAPIGTVVLAIAFAGISAGLLAGTTSGVLLTALLGLGGLGYGAAFSGTLAHLTSSVEDRYAADTSGLFNTTLQVGGVLGVAAFGTVYLDLVPHGGRAAAVHGFTVVTLTLGAVALVAAVVCRLAITSKPSAPAAASPEPERTKAGA
ncbi:MFS transporter [Streptomyces sp. RB6PN25]|uniref:MFS transporter n=1 Tax=Streptomyces humicola TaxID=2953240 RepID=A0ABT1Q713_9ACTN|nr:MFS transporter [Streptomyces humicola]MCQ4085178.1 MFS transporter [Streptomyces humicola]